jgi:hypothetical protein
METLNLEKLIQKITGRDFIINTTDADIKHEKEYQILRILPITERKISFYWKAPKSDEKILRSFITAFCNKYREPRPSSYNGKYFGSTKWDDMSPEKREYAYGHHSSNMYSSKELLNQVQDNFNSDDITESLCRYGFYATEYGIGIFSLYETDGVIRAIVKMTNYLKSKSIPFKNEYSDARWVLRFKLNLDKQSHVNILKSF